jgi:hypothetical protein
MQNTKDCDFFFRGKKDLTHNGLVRPGELSDRCDTDGRSPRGAEDGGERRDHFERFQTNWTNWDG